MASLVRYPGGSKNKGGYGNGPFYVRVWLPNLKKNKLICCHTENRKEAERKLRLIQEKEWMVKADQSLLLAGLSEHRNDGKLLRSIDEALGLDTTMSLDKAVDDYLKSCKKRISQKTIDSYRLGLGNLKKALGATIRVTELSKQHYEKLIDYLVVTYDNKTTINIRLRGIRTFLSWLVEAEHVDKMPFKVKLLKLKDRLPKFIPPDEIRAIYSEITDPVLLSIYRIYEHTGMRLSELKKSRLEGKYLRVIGKGNKERIIPIPEPLIKDYQITIQAKYRNDKITKSFTEAWRKSLIKKHPKALNGCNMEDLTIKEVRELVISILEIQCAKRKSKAVNTLTDEEKQEARWEVKTLHCLRHTFALRMLVELGDIYLVKKLLGHSSVKVTEIYTKFPMEHLKQVFEAKTQKEQLQAVA